MGLLLSGCANTPKDLTAGWTPEKIYSEARDEASAGAWDKAIGYYEKLEGRAAGTALAQQAQIDKMASACAPATITTRSPRRTPRAINNKAIAWTSS